MQANVIFVNADTLVGEVAKTKVDGFRFVTMSCVEFDGNTLNLLYHFDKDLALKHLRLTGIKDNSVPSISPVYLAAFLVENEIQDLFGLRFDGLVLDFERTLYLDEDVKITPFCKYTVAKSDPKECLTQPGGAGA